MKIRKAEKEDYPAIHSLIVELAQYEKAEDKVTNSVQQMEAESDYFNCFVVEENGTIIGIALYFFAYFTWVGKSLYLDDLYVQETHRGKGAGKALLKKVFQVARDENCQRLRWQVLDWNQPAIDFYKSLDATIDPEWYNCDFDPADMNVL